MMTRPTPPQQRYEPALFGDAPPPDAPPQLRERRQGSRGTNGDRTRVLLSSITLGVVFLFIGALLGIQQNLEGWRWAAFMVGTGLAAGAVTYFFMRIVPGAMGGIVGGIVAPSGSSTPYEWSYSFQESLVARGEVEAALASYEEIIAADPRNFEARIRAADVYARQGNAPLRAARLLRETLAMRRLPDAKWMYATNRLVDLYLGPLNSTGRAVIELRHIVDRFPDSREAEHARVAIRNLKRDLTGDY